MTEVNTQNIDVSDYFNNLQHKEILQINFVQDYIEMQFDRGLIRINATAIIKFDNRKYPLPSMEGNWKLVNLINHFVTAVSETKSLITVIVDNGNVIEIDIGYDLKGEHVHMRVDGLNPIYI